MVNILQKEIMEYSLFVFIGMLISSGLCVSPGKINQSKSEARVRKLEAVRAGEIPTHADGLNYVTQENDGGGKTRMEEEMLPVVDDDNDVSHPAEHERVRRSEDGLNISDPNYSQQWYLHSELSPSLGIQEAWQRGYTGKGVVIGLLGNGIDITHDDLIDNYEPSLSYDFVNDIPYGAYQSINNKFVCVGTENQDDQRLAHVVEDDPMCLGGTNTAGVMVATKNNICVVGIAYEAKLASFRNTEDFYNEAEVVARVYAFNYNDIDIYLSPFYNENGGNGYYLMGDLRRDAVLQGIKKGRNGKGSIYVFGAGLQGRFHDDCNVDELRNTIYTITVALITPDGRSHPNNSQCTSTMTAVYGELTINGTRKALVTTDINNTCTETYTSPLSPRAIVSAILALTLQANPDLTWRDIQHLIVETSISDGITDANFTTNGAGKNVSLSIGFGLMNADRMTQAASTWQIVPKALVCKTGTIRINKAFWREFTEIHLVSPQGTDSRILRQRKHDFSTNTLGWSFTSLHQWGEDPRGNWSIRMDDFLHCDNVMFLLSWSLTFHGTATNPLEGEPEPGVFGGYCDNVTACSDGSDCLLYKNMCVNCTIAKHRVINGVCLEDGYSYCNESITCEEQEAWCNSDNTCEKCPSGTRKINGTCMQEGTIGGYCDLITLCSEEGFACDYDTNSCMNCTNGYRTVQGWCRRDGDYKGHCDPETPCVGPILGCDIQSRTCISCTDRYRSRVVGVYCMRDGAIGGYCDNETVCYKTGSGCDAKSGTCMDCTQSGYNIFERYCRQDGYMYGYCDEHVTCVDGTGCMYNTSRCVNCTVPGYHLAASMECKQDGTLHGYCDAGIPCVDLNAGCMPNVNVCDICYAGHTIVDGFCIQDEFLPEENIEVIEDDIGTVVGLVIAGFVTGVLINGVIFLVVVQKTVVSKTGISSNQLKERILNVLKVRGDVTR